MIETEQLIRHFSIERGVTAIIGGGGKTTLLYALADSLRQNGSVLLATSTHIRRPIGLPFLERLNRPCVPHERIVIGTPAENDKLTAPVQSFSDLAARCDYVLVEADGARGLPLKAHNENEPVIPPSAGTVLAVIGLDGVGKPIREVCHRPHLYAKLLDVSENAVVSPALCARVVTTYPQVTGVVLNKADTPERLAHGRALATLLPFPVAITALGNNQTILELWRNGICCLS